MSAPFTPPPNDFRDQFAGGIQPDPEFEAALNGQTAPSFAMRPAAQPIGNAPQWVSTQMVKLR